MLDAAEILAGDFLDVHIAFYEIEGKLFLREMTFTSLEGMMAHYAPVFLKIMDDFSNPLVFSAS